ncbi:preprotein translocase subunit YajC [candidate division CSSED10-310 bacterium]|uniref:Preprotein translocase subunit YajC n=1 Tax=candidate division CSSED10-310 bacterium TaxID=2855610 RepID=A0ABV6Z3U7_UNCC1
MEWLNTTLLISLAMMGQQGSQQSQQGGGISFFLPMIVIFAIFYFLLIRPQSKKQKEHQEVLNTLKKGDRILTTGGIYGTIVNIKDQIVQVKIADKVKIQISRSAISGLVPEDQEAEQK